MYGISQNSDTKDYILVFNNSDFKLCCVSCNGKYTDYDNKWCKPCQINYLNENFGSWTSLDEKIDNFIQEMQLKVNNYDDIVFEWIPYHQFSNILKVDKGGFSTIYSAMWKDGPLEHKTNEYAYIKN